jgi:serine/threonine protein kinase
MSASFIEPGTRLSGRYRLEDLVRESGGSSLWRAIDEILARPVAVRTFAPDFPHVSDVIFAARTASRLTDPRLSQVFDADDSEDPAYVVSEWVTGETLEAMILSTGPIEAGRAATLLAEAAEALAAAHLAGLSHLRLTPRDLLWTTGNTVKILGLAVDGALAESTADDPALVDTQGLGRMLYAALTGFWPGPDDDPIRGALPPAPSNNDVLCSPRQVVPSVPPALDLIVCRALDLRLSPDQRPLTAPAALAEALAVVPRVPLPLFAGLGQGPPPSVHQSRPPMPPPVPRPTPAAEATTRQLPYAPRSPRGPVQRSKSLMIGGGIAALVLAIGIAAWQLGKGDDGNNNLNAAKPPTSSAPSSRSTKLDIQSATWLDDPNPAQHGHEDARIHKHPDAVFDGKSGTVWESETYRSADFGNYERGLGVVLDLGSTVKIDHVEVNVHGMGGATLELRIGDESRLAALKKSSEQTTSPGVVDLRNTKDLSGRYVLLWFSSAPAGWAAQISEVTVYGAGG